MATDPLIPAKSPFSFNVGINYETLENGRNGRSITADLNQITKYFGLIRTYHDVAAPESPNPQIDAAQQQVISYVAKTADLQLAMGTWTSALARGGYGTPWSGKGMMTDPAYTDKWVQMIIKAFGSTQAVQSHLKMILLGNEVDLDSNHPPNIAQYLTWFNQAFDNLSASLKKAGLGSLPVSTTIAGYGPGKTVALSATAYVQQHWSAAWNGGKPIVLFNQYTQGTSGGPMSSIDYKPVIAYFQGVNTQLKGGVEPFIGETGYSTYYTQANQNRVYSQISAWLDGQYKTGGKTVPLFAFDAFDQPSHFQQPWEVQFGIFGQDKTFKPTGLKTGLALPPWTRNAILPRSAPVPGSTNLMAGGPGNDTASYAGTTGTVYADLAARAGYENGVLTDQMESIESLEGGGGTNTLVGDGGPNVLRGGGSNDYLYGQGGDDTLIGGAAGSEPNQLWGGPGNDTASYAGTSGTVHADVATQAGFVDGVLTDLMNSIENLAGGSGTNTLIGDGGATWLTGGEGTDYLYGQGGDDTLIGGAAPPGGANQLWGGPGSDTASYVGTAGIVYADLAARAGYVDGGLADQMDSIENLVGGWNADTLVGDGGANRLAGGDGADALWGKGGADTFAYTTFADSNLVSGYDTIADFESGLSKLDLTALATDAAHVVIQSDAQSTALYVEANPGSFDATSDLAIAFVGPNALAMGDIKF